MSRLHLLLRFALCLTLILNGSGLAIAAAQMNLNHAAVAAEMVAGHADRSTITEQRTADASHAADMDDGCASVASDCCDETRCDAACSAGSFATLTVSPSVLRVTAHIPSARPVIPNPSSPPAHDRYRPPIR